MSQRKSILYLRQSNGEAFALTVTETTTQSDLYVAAERLFQQTSFSLFHKGRLVSNEPITLPGSLIDIKDAIVHLHSKGQSSADSSVEIKVVDMAGGEEGFRVIKLTVNKDADAGSLKKIIANQLGIKNAKMTLTHLGAAISNDMKVSSLGLVDGTLLSYRIVATRISQLSYKEGISDSEKSDDEARLKIEKDIRDVMSQLLESESIQCPEGDSTEVRVKITSQNRQRFYVFDCSAPIFIQDLKLQLSELERVSLMSISIKDDQGKSLAQGVDVLALANEKKAGQISLSYVILQQKVEGFTE